ncbi:hypothetical protein [Histidinibacterium aquaticum]|uniref:Uncharacterized protein n=1 Tax=Histidinibacterium aquaticum TaxID=2613962 RepID=A0A5J5GIH6_9RHOB|nr:hypothetical protein [Histidinibacterium aquaticum]KAA9008011.1 hypothetical protein F3S47_10900 [Histidinibacterium aquaticum]
MDEPDAGGDGAALCLSGVEQQRLRLLADRADWANATDVDAAGVQLVLSAMASGIAPPAALRESAVLRQVWQALALDDVADAELSLEDGRLTVSEGPE